MQVFISDHHTRRDALAINVNRATGRFGRLAPMEGAFNITLEAGIEGIRKRSLRLTGFLSGSLETRLIGKYPNFRIIAPAEPEWFRAERKMHEVDTVGFLLYNLKKDTYQTKNVFSDFPEIASRMKIK